MYQEHQHLPQNIHIFIICCYVVTKVSDKVAERRRQTFDINLEDSCVRSYPVHADLLRDEQKIPIVSH